MLRRPPGGDLLLTYRVGHPKDLMLCTCLALEFVQACCWCRLRFETGSKPSRWHHARSVDSVKERRLTWRRKLV